MLPRADPWSGWDAARAVGGLPTDLARRLSDEDLAALLASTDRDRFDEREILEIERIRRATDERQRRNEALLERIPHAQRHRAVVNKAAEKIHETERRLERREAEGAETAVKTAHVTSRLAEEHRAQVEMGIEARARNHELLKEMRRNAARKTDGKE
jgi:hypothetical protein